MRNRTSLVILLVCGLGGADELVLWAYDFHSLPSGWGANPAWDFTDEGAYLDVENTGSGGTQGGPFGCFDGGALIPAGTDSLVIRFDQVLELVEWGYGSSNANVKVYFDDDVYYGEVVWSASSNYYYGGPLEITIPMEEDHSLFRIRFFGGANGIPDWGGSWVEWTLENFTLTAYGEDLMSLQQGTWAKIKATFF